MMKIYARADRIAEEAIRTRSYEIWERENRPVGKDFEHWLRAEAELLAERLRREPAATDRRDVCFWDLFG